MSSIYAEFLSSFEHQRLSSHLDACASVLFLYDWMIHFSLEVDYIWQSASSNSTFQILYIIQRYLPFLDTVLLHPYFYHQVFYTNDPLSCETIITISAWTSITGIVISEVTLAFRLWAVWRGNRLFLCFLIAFFALCWGCGYVFFYRWIIALEFAGPPLGLNDNRGCFIVRGNHLLFISWVMMMIYDTGTFVMMMIPGIEAYRTGGRSELLKVIYRDGALYFALIFLVSLVNVIVILALPEDLVHLLSAFERVLHSILTSHAILRIRMTAASSSTTSLPLEIPVTRFTGSRERSEDSTSGVYV